MIGDYHGPAEIPKILDGAVIIPENPQNAGQKQKKPKAVFYRLPESQLPFPGISDQDYQKKVYHRAI